MSDVTNSAIKMAFKNNSIQFNWFKAALDEAIQRHAPIKRQCVRANQALFMNEKRKKEKRNHEEVKSQKLIKKWTLNESHVVGNVIFL